MTTKMTAEHVRELLDYDPQSGDFTWRARPSNKWWSGVWTGRKAGTINFQGYVAIACHGKNLLAHRLAWLHVYGVLPERHVDHINGDRADNRINNLRAATPTENLRNRGRPVDNKTGYKGVSWHAGANKWQATIAGPGGKTVYLGVFPTKLDAAAAYRVAAVKFHGEFARF